MSKWHLQMLPTSLKWSCTSFLHSKEKKITQHAKHAYASSLWLLKLREKILKQPWKKETWMASSQSRGSSIRQKKSSRQKAKAKEWLQLMYPHRQWVYDINGLKTSLQAAQAKNNNSFTLATDFWIPDDDSRWIQEWTVPGTVRDIRLIRLLIRELWRRFGAGLQNRQCWHIGFSLEVAIHIYLSHL